MSVAAAGGWAGAVGRCAVCCDGCRILAHSYALCGLGWVSCAALGPCTEHDASDEHHRLKKKALIRPGRGMGSGRQDEDEDGCLGRADGNTGCAGRADSMAQPTHSLSSFAHSFI